MNCPRNSATFFSLDFRYEQAEGSQISNEGTEIVAVEGTEIVAVEGTEIVAVEGTEIGPVEGTEIGPVEGNRVGNGSFVRGHQMRRRSTAAAAVVPRSCSVGMGRIYEDGPCEFGEDAVDEAVVDEDDDVVESAPLDSPPDDFSLFSDPFFVRQRLFSTRSGRRGKRPERRQT
ncbi:hypothetical protein RHGRI_030088 [Rhododendron griersonianum]|uniref:Uncharacterized protein n=1 Tax=Rhododendron griersonianum TaxID=479676 RepID=A0AAV6IPW8_9ERIC|nr:hypothetical protein RHGRI_030088 [Rhododendron griersonianum]